MADCVAKGRSKVASKANYGPSNGRSVLDPEKVADIRLRRRRGESGPAIARRYGIGSTAVYDILSGRRWVGVGCDV